MDSRSIGPHLEEHIIRLETDDFAIRRHVGILAWLLWYNRQRMHSSLNYASPAEYEDNWDAMTEAAA
jgi:transposase InsO family protein